MKNKITLSTLHILILLFGQICFAKLNVVATTSDMGALVEAVGKDRVNVMAVAKGTQDPHQIEAKPSLMSKMSDADLVVAQGLDLESAWVRPLVEGSRNPKIAIGSRGFFEVGDGVNPIEVSGSTATRAQGDVHPGGNPHFQLDPVRMGTAAELVAERLGEIDSANHDFYKENAATYKKNLATKDKDWQARLAKTGIKEVVTYHKTMSYFFDHYKIKSTLQLEPKPGIPPTAAHLLVVINEMKAHHINLVLIENYFDDSISEKLKQEVPNAVIKKVPVSVGGESNVKTNEDVIESLVKTIETSVSATEQKGHKT